MLYLLHGNFRFKPLTLMIVYRMVYTLLTNVSYTRGTFHGKDIYIRQRARTVISN